MHLCQLSPEVSAPARGLAADATWVGFPLKLLYLCCLFLFEFLLFEQLSIIEGEPKLFPPQGWNQARS